MGKLVLIDGHSILNRAFYGVPDLTSSEGLHTNAVYGFLNILFMILEEEQPDHLAVAFDVHAPTFRHEMYPEYKGTRHPMPDELREQVPLIQDVLKSMNVQICMMPGYEADDILGTLAKTAQSKGFEVSLISGDRDLLQISDEHIRIRIPKTKSGKTTIENYYPDDVKAEYGVTPQVFIDMKALMGDTSDNIKGVSGVGPKSAAKLLADYGDIDGIYEHVDEMKKSALKENLIRDKESAYLARKLVTIKTDVPLDCTLDDTVIGDMFNESSFAYFKKLELKNFYKYFDEKTSASSSEAEIAIRVIDDLNTAESYFNELGSYIKAQAHTDIAVVIPLDKCSVTADLIGICTDTDESVCIIRSGLITSDYLHDRITGILKNPGVDLITCDAKSQFEYLDIDGLEDRCFDIYIAAYLLDPLRNKYDIDHIANVYLDKMMADRESLIGRSAGYAEIYQSNPDGLIKYASYAAYTAYAARDVLKDRLDKTGQLKLFSEIEMPQARVLASMERAGMRVLPEKLSEFSASLDERMHELEASIYDKAGETFNILSPKQLGVILFEKLGLKGGKKTKTGFSTSADVLEKLSGEPIVRDILEFRTLSKLKSTYADGLAPYIKDGRIHSTFNQTVTATGRISSADPNLQNIPTRTQLGREIRKAFVASEGCVLVDADYSQIELRILAHMAGDADLIEAYREGQDIHTITASKVFGVPVDEVDGLLRRRAKAVNFGIVYGISSYGLSEDIGVGRKEAEEYIENYFATYPGIKRYLDGCVSQAYEKGYVTTMYGRRRPIPELKNSNYMQRMFGERVAMNSPIQGTAADIMKIAMIRVWKRMREEGLKSRLILQVHDELIIDALTNEVNKVCEILKTEMENACKLDVALIADMHTGADWDSAK